MIKKNQSISMVEATKYLENSENPEIDELKAFIKKFAILNVKQAEELRKKMVALDLMKVKEDHITKIIELLNDAN